MTLGKFIFLRAGLCIYEVTKDRLVTLQILRVIGGASIHGSPNLSRVSVLSEEVHTHPYLLLKDAAAGTACFPRDEL